MQSLTIIVSYFYHCPIWLAFIGVAPCSSMRTLLLQHKFLYQWDKFISIIDINKLSTGINDETTRNQVISRELSHQSWNSKWLLWTLFLWLVPESSLKIVIEMSSEGPNAVINVLQHSIQCLVHITALVWQNTKNYIDKQKRISLETQLKFLETSLFWL